MRRLLLVAIHSALLVACGPTFERSQWGCPVELGAGESSDQPITWRASYAAWQGEVFGELNLNAAALDEPLPVDDTIRAHVTIGETTLLEWTVGSDDPTQDLLVDLSRACDDASPPAQVEIATECAINMHVSIENASEVGLLTQLFVHIYAQDVPTDGSATIDVILGCMM